MKTIELKVNVAGVLLEVARTAGYVGAKGGAVVGKANADAAEGGDLYDTVGIVDEDGVLLRRFFDELRTDVVALFAQKISHEGIVDSESDDYVLGLYVADTFNEALLPAMELKLKQYFVAGVTAKWFGYTNRADVAGYAAEASAVLDGLHGMTVQRAFSRKMFPY